MKLTILNDRRHTLIYEGTPGPSSLIASHTGGGAHPSTDLWGTRLREGDWCRDDYELVDMLEVWPGSFIRKRADNPYSVKLDQDSE